MPIIHGDDERLWRQLPRSSIDAGAHVVGQRDDIVAFPQGFEMAPGGIWSGSVEDHDSGLVPLHNLSEQKGNPRIIQRREHNFPKLLAKAHGGCGGLWEL